MPHSAMAAVARATFLSLLAQMFLGELVRE